MKSKLISMLALLIVIVSCEKEKNNIKSELVVSNLMCYPNDSISLSFFIKPTGGKPPYYITWNNLSQFEGNGPFTIELEANTVISGEIVDSENSKKGFVYEIKKDTINSDKYDYRNFFIGFYNCEVTGRYTSTSDWTTEIRNFYDTIEVSKHESFQKLKISFLSNINNKELEFDYKDSTLQAYHFSGKFFKNDSISFYYYITPIGMFNYSYNGKKIN